MYCHNSKYQLISENGHWNVMSSGTGRMKVSPRLKGTQLTVCLPFGIASLLIKKKQQPTNIIQFSSHLFQIEMFFFLWDLFKRQKMNVTTEIENIVKWSIWDVNTIRIFSALLRTPELCSIFQIKKKTCLKFLYLLSWRLCNDTITPFFFGQWNTFFRTCKQNNCWFLT